VAEAWFRLDAEQYGAGMAAGAWVAQDQMVARQPVVDFAVQPIPPELLKDVERLGALASNYVVAGQVKLTAEVQEKMRSSPLGGALEFRAGDPAEDPLRLAALVGICLALCPERELRMR
jgi:hypothetical protein